MSGIAGIYNLDGSPVDQQLLTRMTETIAHRGPDGQRIWIDGQIGFGHCQFYTTEESSRAHQPLANNAHTCWISCDGRVDNRGDLLREFESRGFKKKRDASDAELILSAYEIWGTDCLQKLIGDFAFCIWDGNQRQLFCARDPFGIRSFFYYLDGRRFLCGSEIRQLLQAPEVPNTLNEIYIADYLTSNPAYGEAPLGAEITPYQKVLRLPPRHFLIVQETGVCKKQYWDINPKLRIFYKNDEEYAKHFLELFQEAVRCRLRGKGPVWADLSGGLDSSSIVCMAQILSRNHKFPDIGLETFSVIYDDLAECDERSFIESVVNQYGSHANYMSGDDFWILRDFPENLSYFDEPTSGLLLAARQKAFSTELFKKGVRIVIRGHGGDHVLQGNHYYFADLLRQLKLLKIGNELRQWKHSHQMSYIATLMKYCMRPLLIAGLRSLNFRPRWQKVPTWINPLFAKRTDLRERLHRRFQLPIKFKSIAIQQQYRELMLEHRWMGEFSQLSCSPYIETRYPFLDRRLVEYLLAIPMEQKIAAGDTKVTLRRALVNILPEQIRVRKDKANHSSLIFRGIEREWTKIEYILDHMHTSSMGFINQAKFREVAEFARHGNMKALAPFLSILTLEVWLEGIINSKVTN